MQRRSPTSHCCNIDVSPKLSYQRRGHLGIRAFSNVITFKK
jgi:hypothetical protein